MNIENLLHVEIKDELEELKKMQVGTDQYKTTVDGVSKLFDRAIELEKLDIEHQEKIKDREIDRELKLKQMSEERKDRFIKNSITVGTFVITTGVTIWGVLASFKFEEEGSITTILGRGLINKLLPKK